MRKIIAGVLIVALMLAFSAVAFASNGEKTATPSQTKFIMDGKEVTFDMAYNIENSNYIQLRSVAQTLSGTKSQFNVYWDDALMQAVIETGVPYTGVKPTTTVKADLMNNPPVEQVKSAIAGVDGISDIESVTENHDPNGNLGKQGGYTGCLYFRYSLVDQSQLYVADGEDASSSIDIGTDAGGCIEIYATAKDAERRNDYLASFDGGALSSGSHKVLGTLVIRTSDELNASQQKMLEGAIINALTNGVTTNPSPSPTPTETPEKSYKIGDAVVMGNTEVSVTKVFTTSRTTEGGFVASDGELFYGITLTVLTPNLPNFGRYWYPHDFVRHILTTDGVRCERRFSVGGEKVYPNQKGSVTIYFDIEQGDTIASIVVSDGQNNNETVSVR